MDKEMQELFKAESGEHLQRLGDGLLRLEKEPGDIATLEEVFREAHSLKGSARMLGLEEIEALAHKLEDTFGAAKKGETALTPEKIDPLCKELDAIRQLVKEALSEGQLEDFRIDTVRVGTDKLDVLMTEIGELKVMLNQLRGARGEEVSKIDLVADKLDSGIREIRLLPLSLVFDLFPMMVRDLAREKGKEIELSIEGKETTVDKRILEEMKDPLMHLLRNAVGHGIEAPEERERLGKPRAGKIRLKAYQTAINIIIEIEDDGRGLDPAVIRRAALESHICSEEEFAALNPSQVRSLIFASGFSTSSAVSEVSGRGVGLDVVKKNIEDLKGTVQVESDPGRGALFRVRLPITLATVRVLVGRVAGAKIAVPFEFVDQVRLIARKDIFLVEGREAVMLEGEPVSVASLCDLLELKGASDETGEVIPGLVLKIGHEKLGLLVDAMLDEQEIVLKPLSPLLKRVPNVSGAAILGTGEVCTVLNPQDLLVSSRKRRGGAAPAPAKKEKRRKSILLVDDSITTRTQLKRILEGAGYEVVQAVDGLDAYGKLASQAFDALVADILMPNMDGLTLTAKVRQEEKYRELPIILVTMLASEDDRKRGIEAGANAYITKPAFDQKVLIDTLRRLV